MQGPYDYKEVEPRVRRLWEKGNYFTPSTGHSKKPYSMFLAPPNASGPMHVGNALMIAIQDILARYHRAKGEQTVWIPGTDHGGYETQITYEREMEERGDTVSNISKKEQFKAISDFVEQNNETIIRQIKTMGASVDWARFRFTLDAASLAFVHRMFKKMVGDSLIYRSAYMVNYCTSCATVLADVELKEVETPVLLYFIKFPLEDGTGYMSLATTRPEFLFSVTHMLIHPQDARFAKYIGSRLVNPSTGEFVEIVASKRKFDPKNSESFLFAFSPSHKKYDFEYAIRHGIPTKDLLNWDGTMIERYSGIKPEEARLLEVEHLTAKNAIERVNSAYPDSTFFCKKGHAVQTIIRMTWFLELDNEYMPLRKPALYAIKQEGLVVYPRWREKGLVEWIGKMHNWPIARQNVWGITIPVWYEISDPALFTVWFLDANRSRRYGNLRALLDEGVTLEEILLGLERMYAADGCTWVLEKEDGKIYLPETDTFDTWFSSCAWGAIIADDTTSPGASDFYPTSVAVTGYDLLRLFISRKILLGKYLTGRLPFKRVFFHSLLKSKDGQKMSKSLGNAVTLDQYLETFGVDVTRMALVSYTGLREDFYFADERLEFFKAFAQSLWRAGKVSNTANTHAVGSYQPALVSETGKRLLADVEALRKAVGMDIEKYFLAQAQEKTVAFLPRFKEYIDELQSTDNTAQSVAVFHSAFKEYITLLHPFMPFMTEELYTTIYNPPHPLAATLLKS